MMVKNQKGRLVGEHGDKDGFSDRFPVGMRVLAVDDDQTCLRMLEKMLMQCRYHVTTTTQSTKALEMLRENKDNFDLVISDVNMPDMDGFKLLELVGLEMDLPVIMLTAHRETNLVKKGVLHGACDYLLKPVRMEELQIIWRHVFRRQIDFKDQNKASLEEKACNMAGEGSQGIASQNNADQDKKLGKRRKEHAEEEEEDADEDEQENEDPSTQKKSRLVWGAELHRKFVAAVSQLGHEKAVPKKILELMNVEGLTRENVASHLQKYRLGIKKSAQQGSTVSALDGSDPYMQMASLDRYASASGRFSSSTLPSYASGGIFSRLNSPSGLNLREMSSSALVRPDQSQNINGSMKSFGNIQSSMFTTNQSSNLLHGIPTSSQLNQFQQNNYTTGIRQLNPIDKASIFTVSSVYTKGRATVGNGNNSQPGFSSNHLLLQGSPPPTHNSVAFKNHSSLGAVNLLDYNRCNEGMQIAAQLSKFPANSLPLSQAFNNDRLPQNSLKFSSSTSHVGSIPVDFSPGNAVVPLEESRVGLQCQEGLIGNIVQASCYTPQQSWEQHKQDYNQNMSQTLNALISSNGDTSSLRHTSNQDNIIGIKRVDASLAGQLNEATPSISQCPKHENASTLQQIESQGVIQSDFDALDDIISDMVKPEQNGMLFMNAEMVFDADSIGSCL